MPSSPTLKSVMIACCTSLILSFPLHAQENTPKTFAYTCIDRVDFTARFENHTVRIYLKDRTIELPQVQTASGIKFEDNSTTFWAKGNEAMLMRRGLSSSRCSIDHNRSVWESARLDGADFRGFGERGKWTLLTFRKAEGILLSNEYGTRSYTFTQGKFTLGLRDNSRTLLAKNSAHSVAINFTDKPCTEPGNEEIYPTTVFIILDKMYKLHGCGKALVPPAK